MHDRLALVLTLIWCGSSSASAQTPPFDFDDLRGWSTTGAAFDHQPLLATTDALNPIDLGGTYWRALPYPIGQHGRYLVRSSDEGRGTLTSPTFELHRGDCYVSGLVGGSSDLAHERIELQLLAGSGAYQIVFTAAGSGGERLDLVSHELPNCMAERTARVHIVDDAAGKGAHISVDYVRFTAQAPTPERVPVWGLADFHTHPMTHMGFGALKGPRAIWGVPGNSYANYVSNPPKRRPTADLPRCVTNHLGGPTSELFINVTEGRFAPGGTWSNLKQALLGRITGHPSHGGPDFADFPSFESGTHQQMHITQIHRAWEGGLRLMSALAVNNQGLEYFVSEPQHDEITLTRDIDVLHAQLCGIRQLVNDNSSWMEIAYSPDDARRIIGAGHLAVVLGIEMDSLGRLDDGDMVKEVQDLWDAGIRQVTPVHAIDNRLGGAAVFQPIYNSQNDLVHRGKLNLRESELATFPPKFFEVTEGGCTQGPHAREPGECVLYTFEPTQKRAILSRLTPRPLASWWPPFKLAPFYKEVPSGYGKLEGMMNNKGLKPDGASYIKELMKHGMLIGLEHMGQLTVDDVYAVVGETLTEKDAECAGFGRRTLKASCYDEAYPLIFSHAHFRALSAQDAHQTTVTDFFPSEYEVGLHELDILQRTGSIVGQFMSEDPVYPATSANDCGGSSKSTASSLMYVLGKMKGLGVGLASDFTLIHGAVPRFGDDACSAWRSAKNPTDERDRHSEQYKVTGQRHPIEYSKMPGDGKLVAYHMDRRAYDFNQDGFAHYGLLPDLLEDLKNVGLPESAFESLFSSAEAYIQTWEKAERLAHVTHTKKFIPIDPACDVACHGLCPDSPNAGAPPTRKTRR